MADHLGPHLTCSAVVVQAQAWLWAACRELLTARPRMLATWPSGHLAPRPLCPVYPGARDVRVFPARVLAAAMMTADQGEKHLILERDEEACPVLPVVNLAPAVLLVPAVEHQHHEVDPGVGHVLGGSSMLQV